jgi:hypothetical protein
MKLLPIGCILLLLLGPAQAEEVMFFADDHYKSLGRPALAASVANPAILPGEGILHINLANLGELEELMPINQSGPSQDILLEMEEEMKGGDALNINAALMGSGPILVTSGPRNVEALPAGEKALLDYNIRVMKNASGWMKLLLDVSYQQQADVSVKTGEVYPLYEAKRDNLTLDVFVAGEGEPLRVSGSALSHHPGRGQRLKAAISNNGEDELHNCSARLLAAPPFSAPESEAALGDLPAGSMALADFALQVDSDAKPQDYQMGCQICCQERCASLPLTVSLRPGSMLESWWMPALLALGLAGLAAILARRSNLLRRDRRRRGPRQN